ncbi:MAG: FadR family transcriptional regulator [Oscillibacter sp.]|jgi:GntR family transcriptional repressor for pyruvate dehydrogenase complex|nr:FadR family transcriptional regulator [Oscillibacter sp.]
MKLSDITISKLIDLITVQKRYQPGDKLPNEAGLAAELGVSRNTIRTAVQYLVGQGVLEIRIGKGTFVSEQSHIKEDFGFNRLKFMHLKLLDLYELRLMLEPQIAYYAAIRATDDELQRILELGEQIKAKSITQKEDIEGNRLFHNAITQASHNEFSVTLMELLHEALIRAFRENNIQQTLSHDTLQDHQLIMDFLRSRDASGVKLAMDLHMKHAMRDYQI